MTKVEILELYIRDLESKVGISPARNNRIAMLKEELKQALNLPAQCKSSNLNGLKTNTNEKYIKRNYCE